MPTVVLLCVNLVVVVMSILSMRAGRELRNLDDGAPHDGSLLLTTTDLKMSLPEYLDRMNGLMSDGAALQQALFEYLYFGRNLIIHRKRMLKLTYDIFIVGLAISLMLFIVAIVWF